MDLSEQFILRNYRDRKELCDGDDAVSALNYMYDNNAYFNSVDLEAAYPYNYDNA